MHDLGLIICSSLALVLLLLPLPLQWRARNASTIINIGWLFIGNLIFLVNACIWWDNMDILALPWCDICVKLQTALSPGLAASSLLINRRLASIASARVVAISQQQKRIRFISDLVVGVGLPAIIMAASYVVQPHRSNIVEGYGCEFPVWPSLPAIFLLYIWAPLLSIISAVYGVIAIRFFLSQRLQFNSLLRSSQSGLNRGQYLRLVALAGSDFLLGLPLSLYFLVRATQGIQPFDWDDVHYGWGYVLTAQAGDVYYNPRMATDVVIPRWLMTVVAYLFFLFFGVSEDIIGEYLRYGRRIRDFVRRRPAAQPTDCLPVSFKLGSSIANPAGSKWNRDHDLDGLDDYKSAAASPGVPARTGFSGITVKVERETV